MIEKERYKWKFSPETENDIKCIRHAICFQYSVEPFSTEYNTIALDVFLKYFEEKYSKDKSGQYDYLKAIEVLGKGKSIMNMETIKELVNDENINYVFSTISTLADYIYNSDDIFWAYIEDTNGNTAYERISCLYTVLRKYKERHIWSKLIKILIDFNYVEKKLIEAILQDQYKEVDCATIEDLLAFYKDLLIKDLL